MTSSEFDKLRDDAWEKIDKGELPTAPTSVSGDDRALRDAKGCHLCGETVKAKEFHYVLHGPGLSSHDRDYRLHFQCHAAWQLAVILGPRTLKQTRTDE
jgi:hypothetical protein